MRLIDADESKEKLSEVNWYDLYDEDKAIDCIDKMPTIDPVKHGKWEEIHETVQGLQGCDGNANVVEYEINCLMCSECTEVVEYASNFCPYCGAKMDGDSNG